MCSVLMRANGQVEVEPARDEHFYVVHLTISIADQLTNEQLRFLMLVVELGLDPYRLLPFMDWVGDLFTECSKHGERTAVHPMVRASLRGLTSARLKFDIFQCQRLSTLEEDIPF